MGRGFVMSSKDNPRFSIEVKELNWQIGNARILKDIGLQLDKNSFVGIIGPNGSGKTTLLRNISSWYKPDAGTVLIHGRDVLSYTSRALAHEMAFVTQNARIEFEFTAMDIVLMGRSPYISRFGSETQEDIEKSRKIMELTKTWELKDRSVTTLSAGEMQRVMIARALVQDTPILLMDEPISNLDINHQIQIMDLIKGYQREKGVTVVMVLHDLNIAAQYCEKLILLNRGEIFCSGEPESVLTRDNIRAVYGIDVHIMENPLKRTSHGSTHINPWESRPILYRQIRE
jgi:iron complex transport system ATP-binding protein